MKFFLGMLLLQVLVSCSTNSELSEFHTYTNCSPRAQEQLEKFQTLELPNKEEERKSITAIKNITAPIAKNAADKCYYDSKKPYPRRYNVCPLISTDKKGKVIFIDIEDNANKLPTELQKCLTDIFIKGDYSTLPSKTFGQPLILIPITRTY